MHKCRLSIIIIAIFFHCATDSSISQKNKSAKYYSSFEFNQYGIPVLSNEIPSSEIADFSYYYISNYSGSGHNIYIIKHVKSKNDYLKPFKVIYEWTGKGFKYGYDTSKEIIETSMEIGQAMTEPVPEIKIVNVPLVIISTIPGYVLGTTIFITSGATGFIIGLKESGPEAYNEIKKFEKTEGMVLGKYSLEYDGQNRILKCIHYSPSPDNTKLSETSFYYYKNNNTPYKSINYSYVDKKKRIVYKE